MSETQELCCTNCGTYLSFRTKPEKDGNVIIVCDKCGHQHCRRVKNGEVTSDRWDSRAGSVSKVHGVMKRSSTFETFKGRKDDGGFLYKAWNNLSGR